jgi:hypothetical protein
LKRFKKLLTKTAGKGKKMLKRSYFHKKIYKKFDFSPKFLCFLDLSRCFGVTLNILVGRVIDIGRPDPRGLEHFTRND